MEEENSPAIAHDCEQVFCECYDALLTLVEYERKVIFEKSIKAPLTVLLLLSHMFELFYVIRNSIR